MTDIDDKIMDHNQISKMMVKLAISKSIGDMMDIILKSTPTYNQGPDKSILDKRQHQFKNLKCHNLRREHRGLDLYDVRKSKIRLARNRRRGSY